MRIYKYDSSIINQYSIDDCGSIQSSSNDIFDCGKISNSVDCYDNEDFYEISCNETIKPFGTIKLKSSVETKYRKVSSQFIKLDNLNKKSIIFSGIILIWYGYGTVFEFCNGLERQVIPDVSGGGVGR